jgi:hypothetical protein
MEKYLLKLFQEWGRGDKRVAVEGMNSSTTYLIHCKMVGGVNATTQHNN